MKRITLCWIAAAALAALTVPMILAQAREPEKISESMNARTAFHMLKSLAGTWTGTMNLTEPHCGTDLGLLRSKAVPQGDGSYKITGTKIFISAGAEMPIQPPSTSWR